MTEMVNKENVPDKIIKKKFLGGEEVEVHYIKAKTPCTGEEMEEIIKKYNSCQHGGNIRFCAPFNPRTYIAQEDGQIMCEQDVPVKMRDGVTIYCDIYRPKNALEKIPVIISWGYFGKRPGEGMDDWKIMGVPSDAISKLSKHESPDPAFWCRNGYAIANVDCRGAGHSEGDLSLFSTQDGQDGYDFIEWVAQQHWCNGRVGMAGNSAVAMVQWRIAAQQPPHLAAICPWEGMTDQYRESILEGGIPRPFDPNNVSFRVTGNGYYDDQNYNAIYHPLLDGYWKDKIPDFSKITCPVYATACWGHFHLPGSINAFRKIRSRKKWLRVHREFEWSDATCYEGKEEMKKFFDCYLKNIRNGWEFTPRVRVVVMDAYDCDYQVNRAENEFPLARTEYRKLYMNASDGSMNDVPVEAISKVSYDGATGVTNFDYKFTEDTEITGFLKLHMWVEADGHDDMDLFVNVQKLDDKGNLLPYWVIGQPHPGAWSKLRVSLRKLDAKLSTDYRPVQAFDEHQKLSAGEIVPVDMAVTPTSWLFHKGQSIRVQIAGRYIREPGWFENLSWMPDNKGNHIVHTGGDFDSFLQIPVIPPRYVAGDYIVR